MDYNDIYKKPEEIILKKTKGSCFGDDDNLVYGILTLTNFRIYLQIDDETKINEILLSDIANISIGGLNVLRCEIKNGIRVNFIVSNVIGWKILIQKAMKNV